MMATATQDQITAAQPPVDPVPADHVPFDTLDLGGWFVLRTSPGQTINLARSLSARGIIVWTPIENQSRRRPRSRERREVELALMPTYVFASVADLDEVRAIIAGHDADLPAFTLFRFGGAIPLIADRELRALKDEEDKRRARWRKALFASRKAPRIDIGTPVAMTEGPFAGLRGKVHEQQGSFTIVDFEGFGRPVKVSSLLLVENE